MQVFHLFCVLQMSCNARRPQPQLYRRHCSLTLPGADPTKLIDELAKRKKIRTLGVSMGQGQEIIARKYIQSAAVEGHWVLLQNAHLGIGYLGEVGTPSRTPTLGLARSIKSCGGARCTLGTLSC